MANDPNRDLLPVKEDCSCKTILSERINHQILTKLSRTELEDKFLRTIDEQTHLKKLINGQEEKIKRLGTKLLRLINERKNGRKCYDPPKETEELHLRIVELEHENYALKDKNIVLKQQLSNHSRHLTHRSPIRSNHTSPLMSMRQLPQPNNSEVTLESTSKNNTLETQLQEADSIIKQLNEEVKTLHNKINLLEETLEKNTFDNRKTKVNENIELIRLQRTLKQQANQICILQEEVKNSYYNQKCLREELERAHEENYEALYVITEKQNKIIDLCNKLEEKKLNRIEEQELKQRIDDLMLERNSLKERSDHLMKTITIQAEEAERLNELKKSLAEEIQKKEIAEKELENTQKILKEIRLKETFNTEYIPGSMKLDKDCSSVSNAVDKMASKDSFDSEEGSKNNSPSPEVASHSPSPNAIRETNDSNMPSTASQGRRHLMSKDAEEKRRISERMNLEREVKYLRDMLRNQTARCEAQQIEISRLMSELKINEEKCNDTLKKLDLHLKVFQNLEVRNRPDKPKVVLNEKKVSLPNTKKSQENLPVKDKCAKNVETRVSGLKKRFVEQVFLDSSDEDNEEETFAREHFIKKLGELDDGGVNKSRAYGSSEVKFVEENAPVSKPNSEEKELPSVKRKNSKSSINTSIKSMSDSTLSSSKKNSVEEDITGDLNRMAKPKAQTRKLTAIEMIPNIHEIVITVAALQLEESSSIIQDSHIKLLFIDFSFLDVKGEEAETPDSLPKPKSSKKKCVYNFSKSIHMNEDRKKKLKSLLNQPGADLIIFKVVSDSDEDDDFISEDVGVAAVTVDQFFHKSSSNVFSIPVNNTKDSEEVVGSLYVSIEIVLLSNNNLDDN